MKHPQPTKIKNLPNWDYRLNKKYLKNKDAQRWILERQLNYGGDQKIKFKTLLKFWPNLKIQDPIFKEMIGHFLQTDYAQKLIKQQKICCSH